MRMDMSSNETLESMLICTKASSQEVDNNKKLRPQDEEAQKCPRCDSCNTKFCYYNNYSLTQPRYFCKSCKRFWTKGGTLRNVPVGGGCRKNSKRSSSSDSLASSKIRTIDQYHDHSQRPLIMASSHNHSLLPYESTDLSLALSRLHNGQLGSDHDHHNHISVLGNFLETPPIGNCLQNVFYGEDHHYENVGNMIYEGLGNLPYDDLMRGGSGPSSGGSGATTHVDQEGRAEGCRASGCATEEDGDGGIMMGEVDAIGGQSSWINGFGSSNWPGFLNSRLM